MTQMASVSRRRDLRHWLPLAHRVLALVIIVACAALLYRAFHGLTLGSVIQSLESVSDATLAFAAALVITNYGVMTGMEILAMRDAGVDVSLRRAAASAFFGNALSLAAGLGPVSGAGIRSGLFQKWGLPARAAAVTAFSSTFMSLAGGATLAAIGLSASPDAAAAAYGVPSEFMRGLGLCVLGCAIALIVAAGRKPGARTVFGATLVLPSAIGAVRRLALGALDWFISSTILFAFLAGGVIAAPLSFTANFATAHFLGMAAGVPAGLGVFDTLMLHAGAEGVTPGKVAAALFLYRLFAYFAPALIALVFYSIAIGRWSSRNDAGKA